MREFIKQQNRDIWRWSLRTVGQIATLPFRSLPGGSLKSLGIGIEQQVNRSVQASIRAGDNLQSKLVDWMFDAVTFKPLLDSFADLGFNSGVTGKGLQAQPELAYMEAVNDSRPGSSAVMIPMIVQYTSLKRYDEGIARLEGYLTKFELTPAQKAVNFAGLALLRAAKAKELPPWRFVEQYLLIQRTLSDMKEAKRLTEKEPDYASTYEKLFAVWTSGILLAQLPWPFGDANTALEDLEWCERTIHQSFESRENTYQFLRQVRYSRAILARNAGNKREAEKYLQLSGYKNFSPDNLFIATVFTTTSDGVRGAVKQVKENVPGRGFTVSGFDLSDYNFFITDDGQELIAVDSGSRVELCEAAYRFFEEYYTQKTGKAVPKLTTCFMTHYHWDHTGGYPFFRTLNPDIVFYSRANYTEESDRARNQPPPWSWSLGKSFTNAPVVAYTPTKKVRENLELAIGGTRIRLLMLPGGGGETPDGMLIHLHDHGVLYCGDFIVPWVGSPYVVEGDVDALLDSMEFVAKIKPEPKYLLCGHWAVTQFYPDVNALARLRPYLQWLKDETLKQIYANKNREEIQQMNLIPPGLAQSGQADMQVPYIAMREVFIDRLYHQKVGYWGPQLQNADLLSQKEIGTIFRNYLGLSDVDISRAIDQMITAGDFELAAQLADWAFSQYPGSSSIVEARRNAFRQLTQKWQLLNVFKFMMYSETIDEPTPQTPGQFVD